MTETTHDAPTLPMLAPEITELLQAGPSALDFSRPVKTIASERPITPKPTSQLKALLARMKYAVEMKEAVGRNCPIMMVTGTHGGGKTFAASVFKASRRNVIYKEVTPKYDGIHVVRDILKELGLDPGRDWYTRSSTLIDYLQTYPHTIILDEAHEAKHGALTQIKHIADNAGITFILIGSAKLKFQIEADSSIDSRVAVAFEAQPLQADEYKRVFAADGYSPAVVMALYEITKGVMRRTVNLQMHLDFGLQREPGMTRADLTVDHVRAAAEVVR